MGILTRCKRRSFKLQFNSDRFINSDEATVVGKKNELPYKFWDEKWSFVMVHSFGRKVCHVRFVLPGIFSITICVVQLW